MSKSTIILNNGSQAIINFDVSKIFIRENRYSKADFVNSTYDPIELLAGTLLGRVSATQEIVPLDSTASDGSQYPVGILAEDVTIDEGDTRELFFCTYGDVVEGAVILAENDELSTVIEGRSIRDRIAADTVGIRLIPTTEMSGVDNQ